MSSVPVATQKWIDELIIELRLRGVSGADIGDAIAQVESHVAESGRSPQEAFGTPRGYADELNLPVSASQVLRPAQIARLIGATLAGMVALMALGSATTAASKGTQVRLGVGYFLVLAAVAVAVLVAVKFLRAFITHPALAGLVCAVTFAAAAVAARVWSTPQWTVSPGWVAAGGVGCLVVCLFAWDAGADDRLVDPRSDPARGPATRALRFGRWAWLGAAVVVVGLSALIASLA